MQLEDTIKLDQSYYMNTFGERLPVQFTHGNGAVLYDSNNKKYIDFIAGIGVNSLGYNHPSLVEAIQKQAEKLLHCSNLFYIESQAKLAKILSDANRGGRVFFCNSGAEANEAAIKLVRKYFHDQGAPHKYEILTAQNSFHGRTLAALAATGQEKYQKPFEPMPSGFKYIPYNNLEAAEEAVTENTAAVMIEVIQGEGGVIKGSTEYIQGLEALCREKGLLLIADEVQTGIGRTGKVFAYEHYDIEPDIITLAKGLGGGIPIGAVVAKGEAAEVLTPGSHGSTFGGNPLACTAGLVVMETILEEDFLDQVKLKGNFFESGLIGMRQRNSIIDEVRGIGLMLGIKLHEAIPGKEVVQKALNAGFIINYAGQNTLRFLPPLIITKEEIHQLLITLEGILMPYFWK